jgi:hypothetical protein
MNGAAIEQFPQKDMVLSATEKKVVAKLVEAAKAIEPIYKKQENFKNNGANFYPRDATKREIVEASKKPSEILSPYTMVERDKNGSLIAIPYHIKFKKQLEKVSRLILEAASITQNKDFAKRLKVQADALLDGNYIASDIYWLSLKPYKINFVIGPIERYDDKLFFTKCSYQSWVGVMNDKYTSDAVRFKDFVVSSRRKILAASEKVDFLGKIQIRVDDTLIFSGLIARFMFTSANLPNDVNMMEKHGSEITIFYPSFIKKFETEHYPIFKSIFEKSFQTAYTEDILKLGSLRNSYLNEISHSLLRYRDAERRLKEYFPIFDEILSSVFGVKSCGSLLLKDAISQEELEAIMVMFISRAFSWWLTYLKEPSVIHYVQGFAIALNFFLENGAIREANGFSWPNFTKLFVSIDELAITLERILAVGTYEDAKNFVEKHASLKVFERFRANLNNTL